MGSAHSDPIERLRRFCLDLPEAIERETWESPTFRVRDKIFAMLSLSNDRPAAWCKSTPHLQAALIANDPIHYFSPPYLGHKGWIGIILNGDLPWDEIADHLQESYRMIAPKRLVALLPSEESPPDDDA